MKKTLLATTALVAVGAVAAAQPASAAEKIKVNVGGYMEQWFGYSDNDGSRFDGFDEKTDAEIHFTGSTKLDNGIEFGINVQLEGQTEGDQMDEQYLFVEGTFGRLLMGSENSAHYLMHYAPPVAGISVNTGDISNSNDGSTAWIANTTGASYYDGIGSTFARSTDNDSNKITYFTPRFEGFQFGVSYIPEFNQDYDNVRGAFPGGVFAPQGATYEDGWSLGLNFDRTFGDFRLQASAGTIWGDAAGGFTDDVETYNFGLRVGYAGFTLGGSMALYEGGQAGGTGGVPGAVGPRSLEGETYNVGGMYTTGPLSLSATWFYGEQEGLAGGGEDQFQTYLLGVGYALGPGITVKGSTFWAEWDAEGGVGGGVDNDGWGVVAGFDLSF